MWIKVYVYSVIWHYFDHTLALSTSLYLYLILSFFIPFRRLGSFNLNWIHLWSRLSGLRVAFIVHSLLFCERWYTFLIFNAKQLMKCATACILMCMTIHHARWFRAQRKTKIAHFSRAAAASCSYKIDECF